jgi:hypothetical protein
MSVKAMSLVGLDVHARQTHAAVFVPDTGEVAVEKLKLEPEGGGVVPRGPRAFGARCL